jgi:hypothetical protein
MIIADVFILHLPTMVAHIGVVTKIHRSWVSWYPAMEKVQIVGFTVQETIISGIYIYMARKMVKESYNDHTKRCIGLLILVQVTCILLNMPFIVLVYTDIFLLKATLTSFAYAIKLKLEFLVLNQLIGIVRHGIAPRGVHHTDEEQVPEPSTRRPSTAVQAFQKRRLSLALLCLRTSVSNSLPSPATKSARADTSEKHISESNSQPTAQIESPGHNTLADSERTTNSVDDEILPSRDEDKSFTDIEKQYLGQYGKRRTL